MASGDPLMVIASNYYLGSGEILSVKTFLVGEFDDALICFGEMPRLKFSIGFCV